jgi:hypothetical protein
MVVLHIKDTYFTFTFAGLKDQPPSASESSGELSTAISVQGMQVELAQIEQILPRQPGLNSRDSLDVSQTHSWTPESIRASGISVRPLQLPATKHEAHDAA